MPTFFRLLLAVHAGLALLLAPARQAHAQPAACQQIRAELASLPRGGGNPGAASRFRRELGRVQNALAANDCYRSSGFLGLNAPPPVCGPLKAQAGQLQAQINAAEGGGQDARRAQLMAAWRNYGCDRPQAPPVEARGRGGVLYATPNDRPNIFERLFGGRTEVPLDGYPARGVAPPGIEPFDDSLKGEQDDMDDTPRRRRGGSVAVCVRTCDGFFFPVNFEGLRARDEYGEVCQALCPAAETRVYFMSYGGSIEDAVSEGGEPYTALPAARKYTEERNLACMCKQPTQTWASVMKDKTDLVELRKGDIVVSKEQAEQMSRPKELRQPGNPRQREALGKLEQGKPEPGTAPEPRRGTPGKRFVGAEAGVTREVTREDGSRATVRNVAPDLGGAKLRPGP